MKNPYFKIGLAIVAASIVTFIFQPKPKPQDVPPTLPKPVKTIYVLPDDAYLVREVNKRLEF